MVYDSENSAELNQWYGGRGLLHNLCKKLICKRILFDETSEYSRSVSLGLEERVDTLPCVLSYRYTRRCRKERHKCSNSKVESLKSIRAKVIELYIEEASPF